MSNVKRTLELSQPWPDLSQSPDTLADAIRYVRSCHTLQGPHYADAVTLCTSAAAVMVIRHPEYFS